MLHESSQTGPDSQTASPAAGPKGQKQPACPDANERALEALTRVNNELANLHRELARKQADLELVNAQLSEALANVKELRGLLPVCCQCKKVRDDQKYWHSLESYLAKHSNAKISHSICPDCEAEYLKEIDAMRQRLQR